ncbi:tRNA (guanosine(46)-N7)-methyltransferase TrmB [Planococcus maritimus]|uniref:tRNA (guanosine(46)-N7)-methyltransferase TrmB n=1 Tax=Planococcus maritimus TaxID=192421 RepID=UPI00079BB687|nr:tRNA (guanosine(46)-N7)-methyltransferase TrmB [Planococcus maritimus]ANU16805.1 tRNA (guanosine(46)-N7)-methyltransferase TrmB [Planococcus maritimus]KYG58218.1 tRNA (guanosine(46)-N7)-methyltransferase TrmB [Planococcus maritimus]OED32032.1 tRNA (guanosine(46)-N7)-methyltransferase TrmB [Planococcus maritimus]
MRARYKPWAAELIEAHPEIVIPNPETLKGKWHEEFGNDHPIHIEAGSGKGRFITGMAQANPDINYIGIELFESVIVTALQGALEPEDGIPNLRLLQVNAQELETFFEASEIGRVYLNFSDPWPKTRHAKRRLTHESFLKLYERVLPEGGEIHFKTDNRGLFEYSLTSISEYGMLLKDVSLDLHANEPEWNIMTEYEEKFLKKGQPIYRLEAKFQA